MSPKEDWDLYITLAKSHSTDSGSDTDSEGELIPAFYVTSSTNRDRSYFWCITQPDRGRWKLHRAERLDPATTNNYWSEIYVGSVRMSSGEVRRAVEGVRLRNNDSHFEPKIWIDYLLRVFYHLGHISDAQYRQAKDDMDHQIAAMEEELAQERQQEEEAERAHEMDVDQQW